MFKGCSGSGPGNSTMRTTWSRRIILLCFSSVAVFALLETFVTNQFQLLEGGSSDLLPLCNLYWKPGNHVVKPHLVVEEVSAESTPDPPDPNSYRALNHVEPRHVPEEALAQLATHLTDLSTEMSDPNSHRALNHVEPRHVLEESSAESATDLPTETPDPNSYRTLDISKILADEEGQGADDYEQPNPNPSKPYRLGQKISNWDQRRAKWLKSNPGRPSTVGLTNKPRVLLVTGSSPGPCKSPMGDHLLLKSMKNKIDYCRLHGIEVFYSMVALEAEMSGFWAKLPLIKELMLGNPEVEFLWWMDSDALFTDMAFEVPWERYRDYNLVLHGWSDKVYEEKDWIGLNTGSFLIRNCQWSLDLLDAWATMGPKGKVREEAGKLLAKELRGRPPFEADDQSAIVYLLASQRHKWGNRVYLENSYCLHGYWDFIVDKYEEMMERYKPGLGDDRWPLVTHFVGCKPCASSGHYSAERCLRQMDRAFGFADNQVMKAYGFTHVSLGSRRVRRIGSGKFKPPSTEKTVQVLGRRSGKDGRLKKGHKRTLPTRVGPKHRF